MYIFKNELKRNLPAAFITGTILGLFMLMVISLYPVFSEDAQNMATMFGDLSAFTDIVNIDLANMSTLEGFYGMEHDVLVNLSLSVFAAMIGGNMLSKEEKEHTSEFLLTHPISRTRVIIEKILATAVIIFTAVASIYIIGYIGIYITGQEVNHALFFNIHLVSFFLYLNIGLLALGIIELLPFKSSFIGTFVVVILYALLVVSNLSENWEILRWFTPFHYSSTALLIENEALSWKYIAVNYSYTVVILFLGLLRYTKRDINY